MTKASRPHNRGRLVIFEGMPGSGKTAVIRQLKTVLGASAFILKEAVLSPRHGENASAFSRRYIDLEKMRIRRMDELRNRYEYVLVDRTFWSTLAHTCASSRENKSLYDDLLAHIREVHIEKYYSSPSLWFLFFVDIQESIKRRNQYATQKQYGEWFDSTFLRRMEEFYRTLSKDKSGIDFIALDTTSQTLENVAHIILKYLS